jgi:hypothetical protein
MPYGKENVKILEGLSGGEVLLQQSKPAKSGQNKDRQNNNRQQGGMGAMGGGFGPPPM